MCWRKNRKVRTVVGVGRRREMEEARGREKGRRTKEEGKKTE